MHVRRRSLNMAGVEGPTAPTQKWCFFLGTPGSGKSAMVNTIVKALCGKFYSKAVTGKGDALTKTLTLQRFVQCGLKEDDLEPVEKDILNEGLSKLPTIIDASGKGDEDSEKIKEILRVYFGDPVDVFVVITKYDLVKDQHIYEARDKVEEYITEECFQKFEAEVANHFSIEGAIENNSIRWVSYVDGHGSDNPHIDNIALRFVEKMIQPRRGHDYGNPSKKAEANVPLVRKRKILKFQAKKKMTEISREMDWKCWFIFALVVVLLAVFYKLLTKDI
ncbi:hypothetical protein MAR_033392 [Mya arenaria]|uniref:G domain-containing protein n=1 Tax=Mya arenaria TaxID=6604 RepID=A0ABY7G8V5_MYAAR|nr:hypothetical protein MAR_033392 [Mya arenaria]